MLTIHKFPLSLTNHGELQIEGLIKVLSVENQRETIVLYALVDLDVKITSVFFYGVFGTGHPMPSAASLWPFLGTVKMHGGDLMFHVFGG